ncbi:M1 family metallopeptidase [Streptomyces sp. FXJ1.172]|uniref:M1 family metallopeptidase n=1 Tax=Streptomyces sp. FXJ1.172 TaxID=710705 RepID=UPI0007D02E9E|nr:M1 family metallopeptidase [Streptomyces sp. FXJ1.172]WEO99606.1 M1 family metallopeptidase [Streptomyces sp. FXJ1.172]
MTRCSRRSLIRGAALAPLAAAAADHTPPRAARYFANHGSDGHRTLSYDLHLAYDPAAGTLDGRAHIRAVAERPLPQVELDLARLAVHDARIDGATVRPGRKRNKLILPAPRPIGAGAPFSVEIGYGGRPGPLRTPFGQIGWDRTGDAHDGTLVASQPLGAPSWFPCNDRPDDKAEFTFRVTVPHGHHVLANGTLLERSTAGSSECWTYRHRGPMAPYLASLYTGRFAYETWTAEDTAAGRRITGRNAFPVRLSRQARHDLGRQPAMLGAFTEWFGPYPFETYGAVVVDADLDQPVENQTLSVFGRNHIDGDRTWETLVAHELVHQWYGNSVSLRNWRDIWLNEGFATYGEWLWSEHIGEDSADTIARNVWRTLAKGSQNLRIADPGPHRIFDDRVYNRGACALHALRLTMGDGHFFAMLRGWHHAHRGKSAETAAFIAHAGHSRPAQIEPLLRAWLYDERLPPLPHPGPDRVRA